MPELRVSRVTNRRAARPRPMNDIARSAVLDLEHVPTSNVAAQLFGIGRSANASMLRVAPTLALGRTIGNQAMLPLIARSIAPGEFAKKLGNEDEFAKSSVRRATATLVAKPASTAADVSEVLVETQLTEPGARLNGHAPADAQADLWGKASVSIASGAAPSMGLGGNYGLTFPETVDVSISAKLDKTAGTWSPKVKALKGHYSMQTSLLGGQSEITGPSGNTTSTNFCDQCENLASLGNTHGNLWYMLKAVVKHEQVHESRFKKGLANASAAIVTKIEAITVPHIAKMKESAAIKQLESDPTFQAEVTAAAAVWVAETAKLIAGDHASGGPTDKAEQTVTEPMRKKICAFAKKKKWPACAHC